ncbi:MAG: RNA polymerase sigma factor [Acidobacteriia bacterium]|nr:RNA polymerase sigma factor [Terriglobia bacterium]
MPRLQEGLVLDADGLVDDCKSGRLSAYDRLYEAHGVRMKSIAFNLLGNVPDAEDAVQEAFLKIYRSVCGFKGEASFMTWIYRVLVNTCYDLLRSRRRREPEAGGTMTEALGGCAAPNACADHPLRLTLEQSLKRLPERGRAVFLLFEVEGFRHREIAGILNIAEGTSKSILFEAKRELQRLMRTGNEARA